MTGARLRRGWPRAFLPSLRDGGPVLGGSSGAQVGRLSVGSGRAVPGLQPLGGSGGMKAVGRPETVTAAGTSSVGNRTADGHGSLGLGQDLGLGLGSGWAAGTHVVPEPILSCAD